MDFAADQLADGRRVRGLTVLEQLCDCATAKDLLPASPMAGIEQRRGEERPRGRVLSADEIKALWSKVDKPENEIAAPTRHALKVLHMTAQRRGELTFAKWAHFDLDTKLWKIPVELLKTSPSRRTKPGPHVVPLSALAIEVLEQLKALTSESTYVLPAHADKKSSRLYSERVLARAVRENEDHFGIEHFTPHDLRCTAASFMTKLGKRRLRVEKASNHPSGDIAEVYTPHDYLPEKCAALERWATHLERPAVRAPSDPATKWPNRAPTALSTGYGTIDELSNESWRAVDIDEFIRKAMDLSGPVCPSIRVRRRHGERARPS